MLKNEVIEFLTNLYAFNIIIVEKKDGTDEEIDRICINYVFLNKVTEKDSEFIPSFIIKWLIVLDLVSAY